MKIRVFALFEEGEFLGVVSIDGVDYQFTRNSAQQDIECASKIEENSIPEFVQINSDEIQADKVLTDTPVSDTVSTPAE